MKKLLSGFSYNRTGWRYFFAHRELWKYALIPALLNLVIAGLLAFFFMHHAEAAFSYLTKPLGAWQVADPNGFWQHAAATAAWATRTVLTALFFIAGLALTATSLYVFSLLFSGPFYESLSERVLVLRQEREEESFRMRVFFSAMWHCFKTECVKVTFFIFISAALFLLSLIPFFGLIFSVLQLVFSAWFFAFGVCTYPLIIGRAGFPQLLRWGRKNAVRLIGFGLPSLIPFVGILFGPFQVVGATLLYADWKNS